MTDKFLTKEWNKIELNAIYPAYTPKVIKFHDTELAEAITETGKEILEDISSKILYRCC